MEKPQAEHTNELTPTDTEMKSVVESEYKATNAYRICISPAETEDSSGETTPDASMLNEASFDVKLAHSLQDEEKDTSPCNPRGKSPCDESDKSVPPFLTPEKAMRPINFKNLSPRSVVYHFSSKYPSGVLRPAKIRRNSIQTLLDFNSSDSNVSGTENRFEPYRRTRARSDNLSDKTDMYENISKSPPKKDVHESESIEKSESDKESKIASISDELRDLKAFSKEKPK